MASSTPITLSGLHRAALLESIGEEEYDLIILGGGITGAGIALDAAARGLNTILLEKSDFAAGTSSRSTKLIHGGLRYLKQLEINLVMETGRERAIAHRIAPYLVHPQPLILPIYKDGSLGPRAISLALYVYDRLAGVPKDEKRKMLDTPQTLSTEPLLSHRDLLGSGLYYEYLTDDARLTMEVLKTAANHGARSFNYITAEQFIYRQNAINGVIARDTVSGKMYKIMGRAIINATGPWVDLLRKTDNNLKRKHIQLTKGVHIVVPYSLLPLKQAAYFEVFSDGRMVFAIPRDGITYLGTTDTPYEGELEEPGITPDDVDYLLAAAARVFPTHPIQRAQIISSWSGLRPLIHQERKSPSELSRKDEIILSPSGLLSIAGGKLTNYRKMAERVVNMAIKKHGLKSRILQSHTDKIPLAGSSAPFDIPYWTNLGIDKDLILSLYHRYGYPTATILAQAMKNGSPSPENIFSAELRYTIENEMVINASDFLVRRTGRLYFYPDQYRHYQTRVIEQMKEIFHWDDVTTQKQIMELKTLADISLPQWMRER